MDGKHFRLFNYGSNWLIIPKSLPEITPLFLIFTHATLFKDVTKSMKIYKGYIKRYFNCSMSCYF